MTDVIDGEKTEETVLDTTNIGRKRKVSSSCVTMKTIIRWKSNGTVFVDDLLGFGTYATPQEIAQAEDLLIKSGTVLCTLCGTRVYANKKSVKRHQTKNRKHLNRAIEIARGAKLNLLANSTDGPRTEIITIPPKHIENPNGVGIKELRDPFQAALAREAWELIQHPNKVQDKELLSSLLSNLGVSDGKDLIYCDEREIKEIAQTLKKIPQRRFKSIFGFSMTKTEVNASV